MNAADILVMGAGSRIGRVARVVWPDRVARWQSRGAGCDTCLDPLTEPEALTMAARGCATILCLAGVVPGAAGKMDDNRRLGLAAVRAGAAVGARQVLLASSAAVYGNQGRMLTEDAPPEPLSDYGRSKVAMEREATALGQELGLAVTSLRIGNIAGVDAILGAWRPGFALDRFPDGRTPERSYIGLETLAQTLLTLARFEHLPPVLNLAQPGVIEMGVLLDAAGLAWRARPAPDTAIPCIDLDVTRLSCHAPLPEAQPETLVAEWRRLIGGL